MPSWPATCAISAASSARAICGAGRSRPTTCACGSRRDLPRFPLAVETRRYARHGHPEVSVAAAGDGVGLRLGGLVDRDAVRERLAARAAPLERVEDAAPAPPDVGAPTAIRRSTAKHLRRSLDTAAHALVVADVDYGAVDRVRRDLGLTYLPFV